MTFIPCRIKPVPSKDIFRAADVAREINPANAPALEALRLAPNNWTPEMVIAQVLTPLDNSSLLATQLADENSIMCYALPADIMIDGVGVPGGTDIDPSDSQFAASVYPR